MKLLNISHFLNLTKFKTEIFIKTEFVIKCVTKQDGKFLIKEFIGIQRVSSLDSVSYRYKIIE